MRVFQIEHGFCFRNYIHKRALQNKHTPACIGIGCWQFRARLRLLVVPDEALVFHSTFPSSILHPRHHRRRGFTAPNSPVTAAKTASCVGGVASATRVQTSPVPCVKRVAAGSTPGPLSPFPHTKSLSPLSRVPFDRSPNIHCEACS